MVGFIIAGYTSIWFSGTWMWLFSASSQSKHTIQNILVKCNIYFPKYHLEVIISLIGWSVYVPPVCSQICLQGWIWEVQAVPYSHPAGALFHMYFLRELQVKQTVLVDIISETRCLFCSVFTATGHFMFMHNLNLSLLL